MHQALPYGLHVVGLPLTDKDTAFISATAKRITNLKKVSGVDSMKMVYDLPDGGSVIVQDVGGNFRVIAHKPMPIENLESDGIATDFIPILYSGIITKSIVMPDEGVGIRLTKPTRHRLRQYKADNEEPAKDVSLHKFRIGYNNVFPEFQPKEDSRILKSQYTSLRATWYSGAMAEVVQIVGGYGIQNARALPDNRLERAQIALPPDVLKQVKEEMGSSLRLPGFTGIPDSRGEIKYDYKFNKTNAVGFDDAGKPWLLQISSSGVWAMPMPIVPATATMAFRSYIERVGDDEILNILNRFGAMPSGETFPSGRDFESWRRAGVIIKVCDSSDFYSHIAYSSACGWSVNSRGDEGYSTCYDYYDDEGLGYGLTYKLRLQLKQSATYKGMPPSVIDSSNLKADIVRRYLESLLPTIGTTSNDDRATLYKLRGVSFEQLYERAITHNGSKDAEHWRNLEVEPIAEHTGRVTEVYRGYLYHPNKFEAQPQIKFPEPMVGACLSHNFLPLMNGRYKDKYPNSDTIMYAYYEGNSLKTIKYFINWGSFESSTADNYENYMTVGSWWRESSSGLSATQGFFYSSDVDDREVIAPSTSSVTIQGEDRGYDSQPCFEYLSFNSMVGRMWRNRYYTHRTKTEIVDGRSITLGVCIPYFCRNAVIYAKRDLTETLRTRDEFKLYSVQDPTIYNYWTYDPVFAWVGPNLPNTKGTPYPKDGSPVWVESSNYSPSAAKDFADNGPWISGLPANYTWLIHPKKNEWLHSGGGGPPSVSEFTRTTEQQKIATGGLKLAIGRMVDAIHNDVPTEGYFRGSPNDIGNLFYRDACKIVFGDATYYNVSEVGTRTPRIFWGSCTVADSKSAHCFIGVINE